MKQRIPETTVGTAVADWLKDLGWEIYPEVEVGKTGRVADIVATRGPLIWIVECKVSLSLEVITQAMMWRGFAHYRSVATLYTKRVAKTLAPRILKDYGIGLFCVDQVPPHEVRHNLVPRLERSVRPQTVRESLHELHKDWATPGQQSRRGGRLTPFALTSRAVQEYVHAHPGCGLKELLGGIEHHYRTESTARAMIPQWIQSGVIPGLRVEREGRKIRLYGGGRGI